MKRSLCILTLLSAAFFCFAAEKTEVFHVREISGDPIRKTGLSGFDLKNAIVLSQEHNSSFDGKKIPGSAAQAQIVFNCDRDHLYFGAKVKDPYMDLSNRWVHLRDGFEIYIDTMNQGCDHYRPSPYFYQLICNPEGPKLAAGHSVFRSAGGNYLRTYARTVSEKTPDGYILKVAIPKRGLNGFQPYKHLPRVAVAWLNAMPKGIFQRCWAGGREVNRLPKPEGYLAMPGADLKKLIPESAAQEKAAEKQKQVQTAAKKTVKRGPYQGSPVIRSCQLVTRGPFKRNAMLEGTIDGDAQYTNPFDYSDVQFQIDVTLPDGKKETFDAFFDRSYEIREFPFWTEFYNPKKESWRWRYLPRQAGTYKIRAKVRDSKGRTAESPVLTVKVEQSKIPGIVRTSPYDPHYLRHETGEFFYSTGYPMHFWRYYPHQQSMMLRMHLNQLKAFSCNTTSIQIQDIVSDAKGSGLYLCGKDGHLKRTYNMENAARLDSFFRVAGQRGVYVIINLLMTKWGQEAYWNRNSFNVKNGGPCKDVYDFFSRKEAIEAVQNSFRYIIARYGAFPSILCWEVFNEIELTNVYPQNPGLTLQYVQTMAQFIKKHDLYDHMVSSSCTMGERLQKLPEIDAILPHTYPMDLGEGLADLLLRNFNSKKPQFGGEVGVGHVNQSWLAITTADRDAVPLRNSLYASLFGTGAGTILHWWNYIHDNDQFEEYVKFRRFIDGLELDRENLKPGTLPVRYGNPKDAKTSFEFVFNEHYPSPAPTRSEYHFQFFRNGKFYIAITPPKKEVNDAPQMFALAGGFSRYLFPRTELWNMPWRYVLTMETSAPGKLVIQPRSAGPEGAILEIRDMRTNKVLLRKEIRSKGKDPAPDPDVADPTLEPFEVAIPAGTTRLQFGNIGKSLLVFDRVSAKNIYDIRKAGNPDLYARTLTGDKFSFLYIRHAQSDWQEVLKGTVIPETRNAAIEFPVRKDGSYEVRFYDTANGCFHKPVRVKSEKGILRLTIPVFTRDIAARIKLL